MGKEKSKGYFLTMPESMYEELQNVAREGGLSVSAFIRTLAIKELKKARAEKILETNGQTV